MKKLSLVLGLGLVIVLVASLLMAGMSCSSKQEEKILRLAVPWPTGDPVTNNIQNFVDDFNKQAAGKYKIELHPGESLVKTNDSVDALRNGAVEMGGWPTGAFGSMDPIFAAAEIPFLANNAEADAAMQVKTLALYDSVMTKKFNSKPVFNFTCLGLDVISTKPLHTMADWKGTLVQSVSPQSAKFIELLGGSSVPMPFPDGYQGLQKKTIEGSMQSSSMMIMFKMNEVATDVLRGYLIPASLMVSINLDVYNKMPKDVQKILMDCGKKAQTDTNAFFVKVAAENTASLTNMGLKVYSLPKAERDIWVTKLQPYVDELMKNIGDDAASKLKAIAAEANASNPYVIR
jgi:TRAP-type transport system periplasmic protein